MKKLIVSFLCLATLLFVGCAKSEQKEAPPPPPQADTSHLTAEDNGFKLSVSREIRQLSQLIKSNKPGYNVVSIMVKVENNSKANIPVSPDFVTLRMSDGTQYKYSPTLTEGQPVGKSAFTKRTIPPDYNGGGLLIFEIKPGPTAQSLLYKDTSNHNLTIKFPSNVKANI